MFFARNGCSVTAFDAVDSDLEKGKCLADAVGAEVNFFKMNMFDFRPEGQFDIIFCSGAFHYILGELRGDIINSYQEHTAEGGLHAVNVFVGKPFIYR